VLAQPQVLGDHRRVTGVGLGAGQDLAVPPGLDRVRLHRHDRVPGFQQEVYQLAVRPLDGDRQARRIPELAEAADQRGDPVGGMADRELGDDLARGVHHAHGMDLGTPVDSGKKGCFTQLGRQHGLLKMAATTRRGGQLPGGH
jgi:hypothetical protein